MDDLDALRAAHAAYTHERSTATRDQLIAAQRAAQHLYRPLLDYANEQKWGNSYPYDDGTILVDYDTDLDVVIARAMAEHRRQTRIRQQQATLLCEYTMAWADADLFMDVRDIGRI